MQLRNFILFSNIDNFRFALGIVDEEGLRSNHDDALLPLVAKGDGQAMKRCIDRYGPLVWSIVCRRISERNDAEETCQEIFTEIWQKAGSYDPETARESTFIGMIARRRSIDWQRKQSRLPLDRTGQRTGGPFLQSTRRNWFGPGASFGKLSKNYPKNPRSFSLHLQGMTHEEIVKETGLPLGTVKTRLRRGLIDARKLLKDFTKTEVSEA